MNLIARLFSSSTSVKTGKSADMNNAEAGYFIANTEFVAKSGSLERFLARGRNDDDAARGINDQMLDSPHDSLRYFLVQRKVNSHLIIHAEFIAVFLPHGAVIGPVATAPRANHSMVHEKRMTLLARVSTHPDVVAGRCYAITVPNKWGDARALAEFGFNVTQSISVGTKASLVEIVGGRDATFAVQTPGEPVPANVPTSATKPTLWSIMVGGSIELGPLASLKIEAHRGTSADPKQSV
jgi:hypothetical protein